MVITNFSQGNTVPYSDSEGRDLKTYYSFKLEVSGALFISRVYENNIGTFAAPGKFAFDITIADAIVNCKDWAVTYWSSYEEPVANAYKIFTLIINGDEYTSSNFIEINWNARHLWVSSGATRSVQKEIEYNYSGKKGGISHEGTIELIKNKVVYP